MIPPDAPTAVAEALMAAAIMPGNLHTATRLLDDAGLPLPGRR